MKKMIFVCLAFLVMAGFARVYMAGGISGLLDMLPSGGISSVLPENINSVTTDSDVEVYKWRDEHGVMHFGSAPPQYATTVEKMNLKANQNIMDPVHVVAKEAEQKSDDTIKQVSVENPYSPEGMADLLDQTQGLADSLSKQQADHKKQLDDIVR